jgi:hypothetical protein
MAKGLPSSLGSVFFDSSAAEKRAAKRPVILKP